MDYKTNQRKASKQESKDKNNENSRGLVILPHGQCVTEPVQRILNHDDVASDVRPHRDLILVHPSDKVEDKRKTDCVYHIPCKVCNMSYVGDTRKTFVTRLDEHKKLHETIRSKRFTLETRRCPKT